MLHPDIFRAYDVRGIYPNDMDEEGAYALGRAFVHMTQTATLVVGYDMRLSAPVLSQALIRGATDQGASVVDIGMVSTDAFYFACAKYNSAGVMNTASHNPPEYGGFKFVKEIPQLLGKGLGMEELQALATKGDFSTSEIQGTVSQDEGIMEEYMIKCLSMIDPALIPAMKIVVDAGNGMGGMVSQAAFRHLPQLQIIPMFFEPNGSFPNHLPDPLVEENKKLLVEKVLAEKADLGIAFDGDADRVFFVDETGYSLPGDFLTALFAEWFCKKEKNTTVIYDLRASDAVPETVGKHNGVALSERVGHTYIKRRMMKEKATFGGEVSGHYYYRDLNYCDGGIATALILLHIMGEKKESLSEVVRPLKEGYFISGEINSEVANYEQKMKEIGETYADGEVSWVDGVSVRYPDFHFNVRPSNTVPMLRLNLEGKTKAIMEKRRDEVLALIRS